MEFEADHGPEGLTPRKIVATAWAALAFGLLACMGMGQLGATYWALDLLNHFYAQYAVIGLLGAAVGLALRARLATVGFIASFGLAAFQLMPFFMEPPLREPAPAGGEGTVELRVLALNVLSENHDYQRVSDWIISEDADVLVLQETHRLWVDQMEASLGDYTRLETATVREDNFGLSIYVRRTVEVGPIEVLQDPASVPWIDVELTHGGRAFHLVAIHTVPPLGQKAARDRRTHLEAMADRVEATEGPVVVAGDLNATIWSKDLARVLDGGRLRPSSLGFLPRGSWPSSLWFTGMILIDHFLVTSSVTVKEHRIGIDVGSDHRGIVADLVL
ncbi:MAG: endonuclease/exonuclease/phosphatase (EEP) superfamily protein YafD [Planctomycetota bacterium]|jgi:endonuclease/exonuclease/phosphatase (EEP) superfamily protein YafD